MREQVTDTFDSFGRKVADNFSFTNLGELRDWLNQFKTTDLSVVFPDDGGHIDLVWVEEKMSDGSIVNNVRISTRD